MVPFWSCESCTFLCIMYIFQFKGCQNQPINVYIHIFFYILDLHILMLLIILSWFQYIFQLCFIIWSTENSICRSKNLKKKNTFKLLKKVTCHSSTIEQNHIFWNMKFIFQFKVGVGVRGVRKRWKLSRGNTELEM